jgi:hypothetical protein
MTWLLRLLLKPPALTLRAAGLTYPTKDEFPDWIYEQCQNPHGGQ